MTLAHLLSPLLVVTSAACLAPATVQTFAPAKAQTVGPAAPHKAAPAIAQTVASVPTSETSAGAIQLTGFVELYPEEGVHLLTGGREITLIGETGLAVPLAGGEVLVTGRYVCDRVFRVESVMPVPARVVARSTAQR